MSSQDYAAISGKLIDLLGLSTPPLAITFTDSPPATAARLEGDMPEPTADGRTGKVSAGCVFWTLATDKTFSTTAADHGNCSVGSLTHGFVSLEQAAGKADVGALVESGWVTPDMFPHIPVVTGKSDHVVYGPLAETEISPDVVFMRVNGKQAMILSDVLGPDLRFEGKPQCHIIPMAKEHDTPAISVGCMLSRVRTGLSNNDMTCAIPAARIGELVDSLAQTCAIDGTVARYAAEDKARFS